MNVASVLLIFSVFYNNAAAQTDSQATCGCCVSGVPGIPGNHGAQGPAGPKGDTGLKGELGIKGETGLKGELGNKGDTGLKGETGLKGDSGLRGEKGNPGFPGKVGPVGQAGVQGEVGLPGATGEKGDKGLKGEPAITPSQKQSAFSVTLKNTPTGSSILPLKYDTIITNIGNHYNNETGKFVCQYPGTYVFQFTSQKHSGGSRYIITKLIMNGVTVVGAYDANDRTSAISNMVVLNLVAGDKVWTAPYTNPKNYDTNSAYCTFSGFLLYSV